MKMIKKIFLLIIILSCLTTGVGICKEPSTSAKPPNTNTSPSIEDILDKIEKKYGSGFSTHFDQLSTLKAMQITDVAVGKAFFKYPGKMRWEYEKPEKQQIITDGTTLWIFRPDENQVMMGSALSYFGDGKGASFLSDIKLIRSRFSVQLEKNDDKKIYILKLQPKKKNLDLSEIYLTISRETFDVIEVTTYNSYGDETKITFSKLEFNKRIDNEKFRFDIPDNADILSLD